jgi:hypothetical protein
MTSFSNKTLEVSSYERAYQSSSGISTMASTSTKFGVTTKNIIGQSAAHFAFSDLLTVYGTSSRH